MISTFNMFWFCASQRRWSRNMLEAQRQWLMAPKETYIRGRLESQKGMQQ